MRRLNPYGRLASPAQLAASMIEFFGSTRWGNAALRAVNMLIKARACYLHRSDGPNIQNLQLQDPCTRMSCFIIRIERRGEPWLAVAVVCRIMELSPV